MHKFCLNDVITTEKCIEQINIKVLSLLISFEILLNFPIRLIIWTISKSMLSPTTQLHNVLVITNLLLSSYSIICDCFCRLNQIQSQHTDFIMLAIHIQKQVCIAVGCVPPACCPYLSACSAWGVSASGAGGACLWCLGGVCASQHALGQTPPLPL